MPKTKAVSSEEFLDNFVFDTAELDRAIKDSYQAFMSDVVDHFRRQQRGMDEVSRAKARLRDTQKLLIYYFVQAGYIDSYDTPSAERIDKISKDLHKKAVDRRSNKSAGDLSNLTPTAGIVRKHLTAAFGEINKPNERFISGKASDRKSSVGQLLKASQRLLVYCAFDVSGKSTHDKGWPVLLDEEASLVVAIMRDRGVSFSENVQIVLSEAVAASKRE